MARASDTLRKAVAAWPGMSEARHRFGGVEFRFGEREIGHLHGEVLLDIPFPRRVRDELIVAGLAEPHHVLPQSGWISFRIRSEPDIEAAVDLLRRSYDLVTEQLARRKRQSELAKT